MPSRNNIQELLMKELTPQHKALIVPSASEQVTEEAENNSEWAAKPTEGNALLNQEDEVPSLPSVTYADETMNIHGVKEGAKEIGNDASDKWHHMLEHAHFPNNQLGEVTYTKAPMMHRLERHNIWPPSTIPCSDDANNEISEISAPQITITRY